MAKKDVDDILSEIDAFIEEENKSENKDKNKRVKAKSKEESKIVKKEKMFKINKKMLIVIILLILGLFVVGACFAFSDVFTRKVEDTKTELKDTENENEVILKKEVPAKLEKYCLDDSYTLVEEKCVKTMSVDAIKEYYCDKDYSLVGTQCFKGVVVETMPAVVSYSCSSTYVLNGNKCETISSTVAIKSYECKSGTLVGTKCKGASKTYITNFSNTAKTLCSNYNGSGNYTKCLCEKDGGTFDAMQGRCYTTGSGYSDADVVYSCINGYVLSGTDCIKKYQIDAVPKYSCSTGYVFDGSQCIKNNYNSSSINAKVKYSCVEGYKLVKNKCEKEFFMSSEERYSCPDGYDLVDGVCYKK